MTEQKELQIDIQIGGPAQRIRFDGLALDVTDTRLAINMDEVTMLSMGRAMDVASRLLGELPHTPMVAVGVNLAFRATRSTNAKFLEAFSFADNAAISDAGLAIEDTMLRRRLVAGDAVINLTLTFNRDGEAAIALNFHADSRTAQAAQQHLSKGAAHFCGEAERLIKAIYGFDVEIGGRN